jgi:hypothetical protein
MSSRDFFILRLELVAPRREILNDFRKTKSKQRKITDFIKPKSAIPVRADPKSSTPASDMVQSDA